MHLHDRVRRLHEATRVPISQIIKLALAAQFGDDPAETDEARQQLETMRQMASFSEAAARAAHDRAAA